MKKKYEINTTKDIIPSSCVIEDNKRIRIDVDVNENENVKAVVIGLNPSFANDKKSDTTLTKISRYLYQYGVGKLTVINLFETISSNPDDIDVSQEVNIEKHEVLLSEADMIIVAWGIEDKFLDSKEKALMYLMQFSNKVYCIADKRGNKPRHPSRISYDDRLVSFFGQIPEKEYPVITLCGSTKFKNEFMEAQKRLTLAGYIVISVGLFGHSGDEEVWEDMDEGTLTRTKAMLDDMHKRKIDMSDGIYVINVGGYIGESTKSEIEYAINTGKSVAYLEG